MSLPIEPGDIHRPKSPIPGADGLTLDQAIARAQAERAKADGNPKKTRGNEVPIVVEKNDTMTSVAKKYGQKPDTLADNNAQIDNAGKLYPGEIVFVQLPDPAAKSIKALVADARQADKAVADAQAKSPNTPDGKFAQANLPDFRQAATAAWDKVQNAVADELRKAGAPAPFPDEASKPRLDAIKAYFPSDTAFQQRVEKARVAVDNEWRQDRTTGAQLDGLIKQAQGADKAVANARKTMSDPQASMGARKIAQIELREMVPEAGSDWDKVQQAVERELRCAGKDQGYPEEAVADRIEELRTTLPKDAGVSGAIDRAIQTVDKEWRDQGFTRDQLGTVVEKYGALTTPEKSGDKTQIDQARTALNAEIEKQLKSAADKVPPEQREMAVAARAALMEKFGPQETGLTDAVDQATHDVLVKPATDAVKQAYDKGGAKAAAEELKKQTGGVSPELAERIVYDAMPTIQKIAMDVNDAMTDGSGSLKLTDTSDVFGDISAATDRAARDNNGAEVVKDVANTMLSEMPTTQLQPQFNSPKYPAQAYQQAVTQSVGNGDGASLPVAMMVALKQSGRTSEADSLMSATRVGVEVLSGKVQKGVTDFGVATETVSRLRADWSGVMTPDQLDQATIAYVEKHQNVISDFDRTFGALDGLGYSAFRTNQAIAQALPQLDGLSQSDDLKKTQHDFANGKEVAFAMGLSEQSNTEVRRIVINSEAGKITPANPTSSASSSRGFVKELGNSLMSSSPSASNAAMFDPANSGAAVQTPQKITDIFGTGQDVKVDAKKITRFGGTMNGLGTVFNGYQTVMAINKLQQNPGTFLDYAKTAYYTIGTGKEVTELLAVGAYHNVLGLGQIPGAQRVSASVLAKAQRAGIASEPGWVRFSTYFKIGAGVIDGAFAVNAAAQGDWPAAGLYGVNATGGVLMGLGQFAAGGTWLATWGGPVGAGLVLAGTLGMFIYNDIKSGDRFEAPSREFLQMAGFKPDVARALADYDGDAHSVGPALAATAQRFGVDPQTLMQKLNGLDADKVHDLVREAQHVKPNDNGQYPVTADNDRTVRGPDGDYVFDPQDQTYRGDYLPTQGGAAQIEDTTPRSETALREYAESLFGQPLLG